MKKLFFLFSAILFAGTVLSQSITLTSPNGGQTWAGCTLQTITWNSSGTSDYYSLDYSTDNGSSWTSITSYYNTTSGSYAWTVPNTSSGICLIRITDSNNSGTSDVSDAVFTITSPLTITSPNGGETWEGSTAESITFTKNGTSNYYDISYSTDAGGNWTSIAYNKYISGTSTNWNIPNTPSVQCLVKITDHSNACMTDVSDGLFEITEAASSVTITSPNGGQVWYVGANQTITWSASNTSDLYNLDYSTDNGASWTSLASNYSGTSFSWTIPNTPSTNCLVRVMDSNDNPVQDQSNATFTIAEPYITVAYPNGGENFEGCSDEYINWQSGGTGNYYRIEYSTDNGSSWNTLSTSYYNSGTSGTFNWDPIPSIDTDLCLVRVTDKNNTSVLDQSDAAFSIEANDDIMITSPNGGESWDVGTDHEISWVSAATTTRYYVYYSVNDGSSWTNITNTYSNTYNWSIPDNETNQAKVKVVDYYNSCILDESDANFTITPPTPVITVTNPNSATTWYQNNTYTIQWNSEYVESHYVTLYYSTDNGDTWNTIESITEDDGSYTWIAPEEVSSDCLIKVEEYDNPAVYDISDTNFSIAEPYITITSPNGGENWEGCSENTISWQTQGTGNYFKIEYSPDNGVSWETLVSSIYQSGTTGNYNWNPTINSTNNNCLIRVTDINMTSVWDVSDANFNLTENTDVILTSLNNGESVEMGDSQTITWVTGGSTSRVKLYYSTDNGSSWDYITETSSNSYNWTIPDTESNECLFKVIDYYNTCIKDVSAINFSIVPPTPEIDITYPNSGNSLYARNSYTISWSNSYNDVDFVTLEFSSDNGSTWEEIINVTENDGSFVWATPDIISSDCQIRISEYGNPAFFDITDMNFELKAPYITITSPNGGESFTGCEDTEITWANGGTGNYYKFEISLDNGTTWETLYNSIYCTSSSCSVTWSEIINESSAECLLKITDKNDLLTSDISDNNFSINTHSHIIITNPNGGEVFEVGESYNLSWVSSSESSRYKLYYSTDNGSTWNTIITSTYSETHSWTVPNEPSLQCLFKVVDYYNTCIFDLSDSQFTISEPLPQITVTSPNSGTYYYNNNLNINWNTEYLNSEFVTIDVSYDNGNTWEVIETLTQDDGSYSWTIPEISSTEVLFRVSEYGNPSVFDVSDASITISEPYVVVDTPNGGESLTGCDNIEINWAGYGTGNYYKIEFSDDNGVSWNTIASSVYNSSTTGSYAWNPATNANSNQCLIKVSDKNQSQYFDISDNQFTITPNTDIVITSPNGGEAWQVGSSHQITWATNLGSSKHDLYYSTDNGNTWSYITYVYGNNYNWTIPDAISTECLFRVRSNSNSCIQDVSDATFSITPPTPEIAITNPDAGIYYAENNLTINWNSDYLTSAFVNIQYSDDNGSSWNTIVTATEDDGSYSWTIPSVLSNDYMIRVSEYSNPAVYDESEVFSVVNPTIVVTSPNGGETFEGCEEMTINWTRGGVSKYYKIEYSTNGGADWTTISSNFYTTSNAYTWSTISNLNSDNCIIRVSDKNNPVATDVSDNAFTIDRNEDIIITTPNGGEFWQVGTSQSIEWVSASTSTRFNVYVSVNDGSWNFLTSTYSNQYNYNVPNDPSSQYKIKVVDYYNSCIYDISDDYFTVTPGDVALNDPNGGETFYIGSNYNITWTDEYIDGNYVKLEYSSNNGASWQSIVSVTENDGSYSWNVPDDISDECLVKVTHFNDESIFDISDDVFSIAPSIVLITPNGDGGGEVWRVCTETSITWTSGGTGNYFKIEYSIDNGLTWNTIQSSYYSSGYNNSYNWTLPNSPSNECLVRVTDNSSSIKTDISDATFTISPAITLTQPNGGESLTNGSTYDILWNSDGVSNFYNIDYSIDGGNNWTNIAFNQNITSDSYSWTVPGSVSQNCLIKVTDNVNTCKTDMSDQVFAIGTDAIDITVDAPAGGEVWNGCTTQTISWTSIGTSDDYDLAYSIDGGASWTSIVDDYNTTLNTYDWIIPNENSANCLIRVKDANNANFYGISPAEFEIASVIADAGENFALCMGDSQQLSASGGVTYAWLPTNGLNDPNIADPIANPTSTTTYTVFVTDANGCTDSDEITITVNPIPASPVAGSNSPVPLNGTLELTASTVAFANYAWTGPNGFTSDMQNPEIDNATSALDGTYEVISIVYGCESAPASTVVSVSGSPASINLNGAVITENSSPVNGVSLNLTGDLNDSFTTNTDGLYTFAVDNGGTYEISASKNNDVTTNNGVSTLDIILMQRHILGVQALSSPYKIIAADVNRSGSVSTLDILYTRALILQTANSFPAGDLWTFVNSDYVFPDAQNPFPYEQTRSYSSATELADQNFIGIKLGDVNNSWNNNIAKSGTESLNFRIENNNSSFGEMIEIPVYADNFNNISGFQMSIEWAEDKLEFVEIENQAIELFFNANFLSNGMLSCLWSTENANGINLDSETVLFTMKFEVISDYSETAMIQINSAMTEAEAYNHELDIMDIQLVGGEIILNNYLNLTENNLSAVLNAYPNPFSESTRLAFYLPEAAKVNFELYSITGKCVWKHSQNYISGKHSLDFDGRNKQGEKLSPGTYILRFRANNTLKNHKLIIQ